MELGTYPFSERYGWTQDRYGLSWQLIYRAGQPIKQTITPTAMYEMFIEKDEKKIARVTKAFLKMKKFDIEILQEAAT